MTGGYESLIKYRDLSSNKFHVCHAYTLKECKRQANMLTEKLPDAKLLATYPAKYAQ